MPPQYKNICGILNKPLHIAESTNFSPEALLGVCCFVIVQIFNVIDNQSDMVIRPKMSQFQYLAAYHYQLDCH